MAVSQRQTSVVIHPGQYFVGDARFRVRTLLGSCVSITLWCPLRRIGAMSHYLLAQRPPQLGGEVSARYGEDALALMLTQLERRGVERTRCEAKVFGGGNMFTSPPASRGMDVGRRNGEAARGLLQAQGIRVVSESLFGQGHRQIVFDMATGHVWCRHVEPEA